MRDGLLHVVVEHTEVFLFQPGDGAVLGIANGDGDQHQVGVDAQFG